MQFLGSLAPWYDVFSAITQTDLPPKLLGDLCTVPLLLAFYLATTRYVHITINAVVLIHCS